jgi:hypothetical protein
VDADRGAHVWLTKRRLTVLGHDTLAVARHGRRVARRYERVWLPPESIHRALVHDLARSRSSGRVLSGDWDRVTRPVEQAPHVRQGLLRWRDGLPWEETGAYADLRAHIDASGGRHQGRTSRDIVDRYAELDRIFAQVSEEGRLRTSTELDPRAIRESAGILLHVGRDGRPLFNGSGGCHRLAMALALQLPTVPAQVGAVHASAPIDWRQRIAAGP